MDILPVTNNQLIIMVCYLLLKTISQVRVELTLFSLTKQWVGLKRGGKPWRDTFQ